MDLKIFFKKLFDISPEIMHKHSEHMDDYGELLEHVFMGDVARFSKKLYVENKSSTLLSEILDALDVGFCTGGEDLKELISVSFLENLLDESDEAKGVKDVLSLQLKIEFEKIKNQE